MTKKDERQLIQQQMLKQGVRRVSQTIVNQYGLRNLRYYIPTVETDERAPRDPQHHIQDLPQLQRPTTPRYSKRITNARRIKCSCGTLFTTPFGAPPQAFDSYITHFKHHLRYHGEITTATLTKTEEAHHITQYDEKIMYDDNTSKIHGVTITPRIIQLIIEELKRRGKI